MYPSFCKKAIRLSLLLCTLWLAVALADTPPTLAAGSVSVTLRCHIAGRPLLAAVRGSQAFVGGGPVLARLEALNPIAPVWAASSIGTGS